MCKPKKRAKTVLASAAHSDKCSGACCGVEIHFWNIKRFSVNLIIPFILRNRKKSPKMLIIPITDTVHIESGIQELAEQVVCESEDMERMEERDDILRLSVPTQLLGTLLKTLNNTLHEKMVRKTLLRE
jgi:hypothetical protein